MEIGTELKKIKVDDMGLTKKTNTHKKKEWVAASSLRRTVS